MPKNQYKGKRVNVTLPPKTYDALVAMAEADTKPVAQAATAAITEVLRQRKFLEA